MLNLTKSSKIIGQGITGSEGSTAAEWMIKYGTNLAAGVTPGKGGQQSNGVPIFNSVKEAIDKVGMIDVSVQYVPPLLTKNAVFEALDGGVKTIVVIAEKVPTQDEALIYEYSKQKGAQVLGPATVGVINPSLKIKIGSIGGPDPDRVFVPGNVAVISKSGGMTSECSLLLKNNSLGVSWAACIGGDIIPGSDFVDLLLQLEQDEQTKTSIIFGELGGTYEEKVAEAVKAGKIKKPVIAFIAGEFTMSLPNQVQFGHAGAIIERERGRPDFKRKVLKEAGVLVTEEFDQIASLVQEALKS